MLPNTLTNMDCYVDGVGYVGRIKEFTLPKLTKKTVEHFNGGMAAPVKVPVAYETIQTDLTFADTPDALVSLVSKQAHNAVRVRLVGQFVNPSTEGSTADIEVAIVGMIEEMDMGSFKRGEQPETKFMITASHYAIESAGTQLLEIDALAPFNAPKNT